MNAENKILKRVRTIPIIIGLLLIFYSLFLPLTYQEVPLSEDIAMKHTIQSYVFGITGIILIFNGFILGIVIKYIHSRERYLENRIYKLRKEMSDK